MIITNGKCKTRLFIYIFHIFDLSYLRDKYIHDSIYACQMAYEKKIY